VAVIGVAVAEGKICCLVGNHPVLRAGVSIEAIRSGRRRRVRTIDVQVDSGVVVFVALIDLSVCLVVSEIFIARLVGLLVLMNALEEALHDLSPIPFMLAIC